VWFVATYPRIHPSRPSHHHHHHHHHHQPPPPTTTITMQIKRQPNPVDPNREWITVDPFPNGVYPDPDFDNSYCAPDYQSFTRGGSKVKGHFDWDNQKLHAEIRKYLEQLDKHFT
jgi:hypothetical protein